MRITDHFRGIYRVHLKLAKKYQKMSTCKWLDLEAPGSRPIMPKNLPNHWFSLSWKKLLNYYNDNKSTIGKGYKVDGAKHII